MTRELDSSAVYRALLALGPSATQSLATELLRFSSSASGGGSIPSCATPPSTPLQGINFLTGYPLNGSIPAKLRHLSPVAAPRDDFAIPTAAYRRNVPSTSSSMDDFDIRYPERPHGSISSSTMSSAIPISTQQNYIMVDESSSDFSSASGAPSPTFHPAWESTYRSPSKRRKISESGDVYGSQISSGSGRSSSRLQFTGSSNDDMELSDESYELEEGEIREDIMAVDVRDQQRSPRAFQSLDSRDRSKSRRRNERDRDLQLHSDFDHNLDYPYPHVEISDDMDQDVVMTEPDSQPTGSVGGFSAFPALFSAPASSSSSLSSRSNSTSSISRSGISFSGDFNNNQPADHDPSYKPAFDGTPSCWIKIDESKPILVLDVANVAFSMDNKNFKCEAIQRAGEYFQSKGYRVRGIIRDTFLRVRHVKGALVDRPEYLRYLKESGLLEVTSIHDDPVAIRYAFDRNGFIVSNDKFRDQMTYGEAKLAAYLKFARISVDWKFGEFTPTWGDNAFLPGERG